MYALAPLCLANTNHLNLNPNNNNKLVFVGLILTSPTLVTNIITQATLFSAIVTA